MNLLRLPVTDEEIPLSRLDWEDETCRLSYGRPLEKLYRSLTTVGLQQRPLLQEKSSGRYRIVVGYRRLRVLEKMKKRSAPVRIVSAGIPPKDLFLMNFFDNADRGFNPVEKVLAVKGLCRYLDEKSVIQKYLPLMDLPPQKEILRRYSAAGDLSPVFWPALLEGKLHPETMETLLREFPSWARLLPALFVFLHLSFQKQREFLADWKEIGIRYRKEGEEVLLSPELQTVWESPDLNPVQKGEALRRRFRSLLFPLLTKSEERFRAVIAGGKWDARTRITPPPYFEGGQYLLQIRFSNPSELLASLEKVMEQTKEGKLDALP